MKRTIIYVFTPKRLQRDYQSGLRLPDFPLGWIKIGKTSSDNDDEDKWDVAYNRIKQEVRTGISETCVLVDVFEYPEISGNPDDTIRELMTSDIYDLQDSQFHNQSVNPQNYEVKAGREYIYGASRKQVLAAIAKFERNLLLDAAGTNKLSDVISFIQKNNETSIEDSEENNHPVSSSQDIQLYDHVVEELKNLNIKATHPNNKNYGLLPSTKKYIRTYSFGFSFKRNQATIAIETSGLVDKKTLEEFILANNIRDKVALSGPLQGIKNKDKYAWKLIQFFDEYDAARVKNWFVDNIARLHNLFE
jgi:hypothetical protein